MTPYPALHDTSTSRGTFGRILVLQPRRHTQEPARHDIASKARHGSGASTDARARARWPQVKEHTARFCLLREQGKMFVSTTNPALDRAKHQP